MTNQFPFKAKITLPLCLAILAMTVVALASPEFRQTGSASDQEKRVRAFVEAFNARNIDAMLELADENIQWMIIDGAKVSVETEGKAALRESMGRYFKSCPSCQSSLEWVQVAGSRVTAMERASWTSKNLARSQKSLSVYEFSGTKILRVYYFPAEAVTPVPPPGLSQTKPGKNTGVIDSLPVPNDEEIRKILSAHQWRNPYVMVYTDSYELILHDRARTEARLSLDELEATLLKMPRERWPFGRVIAVQEIGLRATGDDVRIALAMEALKRMLQSYKVRVDLRPTG